MDAVRNDGYMKQDNIFTILSSIVQDAKRALERDDYDFAMPMLHDALADARKRMALDSQNHNWPPVISLILATLAKAYEKRSILRTEASVMERTSDLNRAQELYETASEVLMGEDDEDITDYGHSSNQDTHHDC